MFKFLRTAEAKWERAGLKAMTNVVLFELTNGVLWSWLERFVTRDEAYTVNFFFEIAATVASCFQEVNEFTTAFIEKIVSRADST